MLKEVGRVNGVMHLANVETKRLTKCDGLEFGKALLHHREPAIGLLPGKCVSNQAGSLLLRTLERVSQGRQLAIKFANDVVQQSTASIAVTRGDIVEAKSLEISTKAQAN